MLEIFIMTNQICSKRTKDVFVLRKMKYLENIFLNVITCIS